MPAHTVVLTVGLKITDNEARSALEAIRVKMGLGDEVVGLAREDLWELDVEAGSPEAARAVVARLVEATNLFANPNKHRHLLAAAGAAPGADLAPDEVAILVSDREVAGAVSTLAAVRRSGERSVAAVRRCARWRVRLARPPTPGNPGLLPLLRSIAVTESRTEGLLSNPHSQTVRAVFPWGEEKPLVG
jgi:hypothetical protein